MPNQESDELSPQTRQQVSAVMLDAVDVFYRLRERLPASLIATFLKAATNEGATVSELAVKCCVSGAVMSRHLGELGARNRRGGAGLGLVAVVPKSPWDLRERQVVLTEKGIAIARQLNVAARGGGPWAQQLRKRSPPQKPVTP